MRYRNKVNKIESMMQEWMGESQAANEIMNWLPEAVSTSDLLTKIVDRTISPEINVLIELKEQWAEIVGKEIARVTTPHKIHKQALYVEVKHSLWLREMRGSQGKALKDKVIKHVEDRIKIQFVNFIPSGSKANSN